MRYIVFDTETTGLNRRRAKLNEPASLHENGDEVIQIGGLILNEQLDPVRAFCHYCDCLLPDSNKDAKAVHGIDLSKVRQVVPYVFLEDVLLKWIPEFFSDNVIFIGYNNEFDVQMVAQSVRNFCFDFEKIGKVTTRVPRVGRWYLDIMAYLPKRVKLVSFYNQLSPAREAFYREYSDKLPLETNAPELLEPTWSQAHNSLFDSIESYLLFKEQVWQKRIFVGR